MRDLASTAHRQPEAPIKLGRYTSSRLGCLLARITRSGPTFHDTSLDCVLECSELFRRLRYAILVIWQKATRARRSYGWEHVRGITPVQAGNRVSCT